MPIKLELSVSCACPPKPENFSFQLMEVQASCQWQKSPNPLKIKEKMNPPSGSRGVKPQKTKPKFVTSKRYRITFGSNGASLWWRTIATKSNPIPFGDVYKPRSTEPLSYSLRPLASGSWLHELNMAAQRLSATAPKSSFTSRMTFVVRGWYLGRVSR